jgi:hypothetical protein
MSPTFLHFVVWLNDNTGEMECQCQIVPDKTDRAGETPALRCRIRHIFDEDIAPSFPS